MTTELDLDALRVALRADLALLLTTADARGGLRVVARAGAPAAHLPDEVLAPEGSLLARVLAGAHPPRLPRLALLSAGTPGRSRRLGPAIVVAAEDPEVGGAVVVLARRLPRPAFDDTDVARARDLLAACRTTPATQGQAPVTPAPATPAPMTPAPMTPAQAMGGARGRPGPPGPPAGARRAPGSALAGLTPSGSGPAAPGSGDDLADGAASLDALVGGPLFRSAFELAPMGMALVDGGLRYRWVNSALCAMLGRERQGLLSLTATEIVHPEHAERLVAFFDRVRRGDPVRDRVRFRLPDGTRMWADIGASPFPGAGTPLYLVQQCDVTTEQDLSEERAHRAMHDDLTGLANRALLRERLHGVLARRGGSRAVAFYLDVDRFKRINDRHGHTGGDEVLRETARRLAEVVRDGDTVARVGGDEFVVAGEVADPVEAAQIAERIAAALRPPYDLGGVPLIVTVSVGVALSVPSDAPDDLVARADRALFVAKRHPRPRLVRLDPPPEAAGGPRADAPIDLAADGSPVRPG